MDEIYTKYWKFEKPDDDNPDEVWRYELTYTELDNTFRLFYYDNHAQQWRFGHAKELPSGMHLELAARIMQDFQLTDLDFEEYNSLLPGFRGYI